jgi:hypothetical protein
MPSGHLLVEREVVAHQVPERLDVLYGRPQRVYLGRLVLQMRDVVAEGAETTVDRLHAVALPGVAARHGRGLQGGSSKFIVMVEI